MGRGPFIDEAALVDALCNQKIPGAGRDVFAQEPLPPESPLWDLANLLITPDTAGMIDKPCEQQYELLAENLKRYLNHQPPLARVDKHRGY